MSGARRVAVLASGSGTDFQAILDRLHRRSGSPAQVVLLLASRDGIRAIERAKTAGVPWVVMPRAIRESDDVAAEAAFLENALREAEAELVVLAGYLRLVPAPVVQEYRGRMINIHPALLPTFGGEGMFGARVHRAVVDSGVRVTGVTVHFVDEAYDRGPIIAQWPVPVHDGDSPESVAARVLEVEHEVLPAVVEALARGDVRLDASGGVSWSRPWFAGDRFTIETG